MYVAVLDCSARDALASWWSVASRNNMRISSELGNPALLVQRRTDSNDLVWATIKKMPFPLHNREFVGRQVCAADTNGDFLVTAVPTDEVIDYGVKTNTVRGVGRSITRLAPEGYEQCKVTYHMYLDANGRIPTFVMNSKIPLALGAVDDLRDAFQRDDEIDKLERDQLARVIKDEPQTYTAEEGGLINKVNVKLGMLEWEHFEELESPDHLVRMGKIFTDGSHCAIIRASVTVDATAEQCAAWEMCQLSREAVRNHGTLPRALTKTNAHNSVYNVVYDFKIPGFLPREFLMQNVWRRQGDKLAIVYDDIDSPNFPPNSAYVRGTTTVFWEYEKLQPVGGLPQIIVTWTQQVDLGGLIPKSVVSGQAVNQLMGLSSMRKRFDRSLEIDREARARNVEMIIGHDRVEYSEEENRILTEGEKHFTDFQGMKAKALEMKSLLTKAEIAFKKKNSHAWGRATTTARARPEEVLAFIWDAMKRSARQEDDLEKSVEEQVNGHNMLTYNKKRSPKIIADRDFLGRGAWRKEGDGFVYVTSPEESDARPITDGVVRGKYPSAMKIKRKSDKETTLEYVIHPDAGGHVPSFIMKRYLGSSLSYVTEIQEYFQALRGLEEWDADDARAVGEVMCIETTTEKYPEKGENKQSARMRELFKKYQGLDDVGRKYHFFEGLMARVVRSTLKPAGAVKSKLSDVSLKEGDTIGRGLAMALACNLTAEAAVDEWVLKHR